MNPAPRLAWLFDVDGTILRTQGAAREAFALAVGDVLGRPDDLEDIAFAGRIEPQILADILAKHGIEPVDGLVLRFWEAVLERMREVFRPGRGILLAGVTRLLDAIDREPGWVPTLLTGNMSRMARIKLDYFGITPRFTMGAFGEEARSRDELACLAVERIRERYGIPASRCIVVGDTVHDIKCARAANAKVVAVATGPANLTELEGGNPDLALADLTGVDELIAWARQVAAGG